MTQSAVAHPSVNYPLYLFSFFVSFGKSKKLMVLRSNFAIRKGSRECFAVSESCPSISFAKNTILSGFPRTDSSSKYYLPAYSCSVPSMNLRTCLYSCKANSATYASIWVIIEVS